MSYYADDTVAAIATASGGAARGIVRISGPQAIAIAGRCFVPDDGEALERLQFATAIPGHMRIVFGRLVVKPTTGRVNHDIPCDLFLWPTTRSYTRQPVAELHTLGSPPIIEAVLAKACEEGARLAAPGEFTLRAFLAGRIDLTQAEAVLGVIDARGEDDLKSSLAQLAGGVARPLHNLRDELLQLLAELEAGLDFVEDDIHFISPDEILKRLDAASRLLGEVADQMASRLSAADLEQVALIGPPNAGKSSLFNALAARKGVSDTVAMQPRSPALVSPHRGTTRDYLTATIMLDGIRCELVDTAGVEGHVKTDCEFDSLTSTPTIEAAAQALAAQRRSRSVVQVWCSDAVDAADSPSDCDVVALTKSDVVQHSIRSLDYVPTVVTSSRTGAGLEELCEVLRRLLTRSSESRPGAIVAPTAERCRESIRMGEAALKRASETVASGGGDELAAEEIRLALTELGKVVGAVYTDDLLDRIFSSFCIGK